MLSKIIIFVTRHNRGWFQICFVRVVNCFQKLLSSWHDTTASSDTAVIEALWIAFKNYYLRDTTQRRTGTIRWSWSCELLSKIIIFVTRHNWDKMDTTPTSVVNCFQKLLSSWHDTTKDFEIKKPGKLWIAFKNYYLRDTTQLWHACKHGNYRCELLSKIIIFVTRHNSSARVSFGFLVVNCFQKLLSSWHDTTRLFYRSMFHLLWIAFKNYYLRDTTQLVKHQPHEAKRCELLSKIIIFVTRHNNSIRYLKGWSVVNCFQKLLSSWHDTTEKH